MRGMLDALEELAGELGFAVELEDYEVALGIAAAHGRDSEGMNHAMDQAHRVVERPVCFFA